MTAATSNTVIESPVSRHAPGLNQNGILRTFVASRKKYFFFKRCFDIVFSLLLIVLVLSWIIPLFALLIFIDSKGPVFFRQKRIGKGGIPFKFLKFRTMVINDESDDRPARDDDDRITRVGKWLRKTNMDELPQFFNVLAGQMSVVGPRPHMVADCIRFSFVIPSYSFRSVMRPGITGWAQVNGFHGPTLDYESIILRYYWDAMYVRKATALIDVKIIFATLQHGFKNMLETVSSPFRKKGAATPKTIAD